MYCVVFAKGSDRSTTLCVCTCTCIRSSNFVNRFLHDRMRKQSCTCALQVKSRMSYINIGDFTSGKQDYWSWAHLKSFVGQDEAAEHFYAGEPSTVAA